MRSHPENLLHILCKIVLSQRLVLSIYYHLLTPTQTDEDRESGNLRKSNLKPLLKRYSEGKSLYRQDPAMQRGN